MAFVDLVGKTYCRLNDRANQQQDGEGGRSLRNPCGQPSAGCSLFQHRIIYDVTSDVLAWILSRATYKAKRSIWRLWVEQGYILC